MKEKTLTRIDLVDNIQKDVNLSRKIISDVVTDVFDTICETLENGEDVKLSTFGTFQIRSKNERIGRNPKTGKEVSITPRRVVSFKPSNILKQKVINKK